MNLQADVQENEVGCVTTCCMSCRGDFCDVCNKLNKYDPDRCPCLEDLAEEDLRKLLTRLEERDLVRKISPQRSRSSSSSRVTSQVWEDSKIWPLVKDMKMKDDMIEDDCKPACCPTLRCTPLLCPICYRRNKINNEACPCIKFWLLKYLGKNT